MNFFEQALEKIDGDGLMRQTRALPNAGGVIVLDDGRTLLNFSSNDYLGLANHPHVKQRAIAAIERLGCSASASRLMSGSLELHSELEAALAALTGMESALVFSSGFGMNTGVVAALAEPGSIIFSDRLNHASLIDGARLSRAEVKRFQHNDPEALERLLQSSPASARRIILCESVYSMDGDRAPISEWTALAAHYDAMLVVDEAHALGVFGAGGGLCRESGCAPTVVLGTLGKSLGSLGGFAAGSAACRAFLVNRARSFIFATALPPACVAAALGAVECIAADPEMGASLMDRASGFHARLRNAGLQVPDCLSPIIPIHVGENRAAVELAERLRTRGLLVTAVRPPTVPPGTARLRLSVTLSHTEEALDWAAGKIATAAREAGLA